MTDPTPTPGKTPNVMRISRMLGDAGFGRSTKAVGLFGPGFKLAKQGNLERYVSLRFYGGDVAADLAEIEAYAEEVAYAYAEVLSDHYAVEVHGKHVYVYPLPEERAQVPGRPLVKSVRQVLADAGIKVSANVVRAGGGQPGHFNGAFALQRSSYVYVAVRGWGGRSDDQAAGDVMSALQAAGYGLVEGNRPDAYLIKVVSKPQPVRKPKAAKVEPVVEEAPAAVVEPLDLSDPLAAAKAATPEQLVDLAPPQIDEMNAALDRKFVEARNSIDTAFEDIHCKLGERKKGSGRSKYWPTTPMEAEAKLREKLSSGDLQRRVPWEVKGVEQLFDDLDASRARLEELRGRTGVLHEEYKRRGGWSRFFLVTSSSDGHIHKTHWLYDGCPSLRETTTFAWHPHLSGMTEADAVKALGPHLCTHCFHSAPLEWKQDPAEAKRKDECPGSRKDAYKHMTEKQRRLYMRYGTCPDCGESISVTSTWKFRAHKPKK